MEAQDGSEIPRIDQNALDLIRAFENKMQRRTVTGDIFCSFCGENWPGRTMRILDDGSAECANCTKRPSRKIKWSRRNDVWPSPIPLELQNLTPLEEMLIARIHPCMILTRIVRSGLLRIKGHSISFLMDHTDMVRELNSLPVAPAQLPMLVVRQEGVEGVREHRVHRERVRTALIWLKHNNPYYSNIEIDEAVLQSLPEDGEIVDLPSIVSEDAHAVVNHVVDENALGDETAGGFRVNEEDEQSIEGNAVDVGESAGGEDFTYGYCPTIPPQLTEDDRAADFMQRTRREEPPVVPWPTRSAHPVSEYNTPGLYSKAFPVLFPDGRGDFSNAHRLQHISLSEYATHLLNWHDGRFVKHERFKFFLLNLVERHRAHDVGNAFINAQSASDNLTVDSVVSALNAGDESLVQRIMVYGEKCHGTRQYWFQRRRELEEMVR